MFSDAFVMQHHSKWRYLQNLHGKVSNLKRSITSGLRPFDKSRSGWECAVCKWWNDRIQGKEKRCLYLCGRVRYQESVCVEKLLCGIKREFVYMPVQGQFFCMGLRGERIFSCFV